MMLSGKTAFVTGGSGAIGQAIIKTMARKDAAWHSLIRTGPSRPRNSYAN